MSKVTDMIKAEEGYSSTLYKCTMGYNTIGYGYNIDAGMSEEEAELLLAHRLDKLADSLRNKYEWFHRLNENRQAVLISMAYQLGERSFSRFKKTIACLEVGDFKGAAAEAKDSKAYKQTTNRWERQLKMLEEG